MVSFAATVMIAAPAAWAVGWTVVGVANVRLNEMPGFRVGTSQAVYSSSMRLYVGVHSPCGSYLQPQNFALEYIYGNGNLYAWSTFQEICTAAETPFVWNVDGGNKWDICYEQSGEFTNPLSTCQRYSTT